MALFGRRRANSSDDDPTTNIVALAQLRLSAHGITTEVAEGTSGVDTVLVDEQGRAFPLRNLMAHLVPLSPQTDEYHEYLMTHVDSIVAAMAEPPATELSDAEWLKRVRIRVLPSDAREELPAHYAQTVTPELIAVLCIDNPTSITFVKDADLAGRDVRASFDAGFRNVMAEPIDENAEVAPGVQLLAGESIFIASKVVGIASLIGTVLPEAPNGVIVGVPFRNVLFAHVVTGAASVGSIGELAGMVARGASDDAPSGPLSASIYYWRDGVFENIGGPDSTGKIHIRPSDRLMAVLNAD